MNDDSFIPALCIQHVSIGANRRVYGNGSVCFCGPVPVDLVHGARVSLCVWHACSGAFVSWTVPPAVPCSVPVSMSRLCLQGSRWSFPFCLRGATPQGASGSWRVSGRGGSQAGLVLLAAAGPRGATVILSIHLPSCAGEGPTAPPRAACEAPGQLWMVPAPEAMEGVGSTKPVSSGRGPRPQPVLAAEGPSGDCAGRGGDPGPQPLFSSPLLSPSHAPGWPVGMSHFPRLPATL